MEENKGNSAFIVLTVIVVLLVLGVFGFVVWYFSQEKDDKDEGTKNYEPPTESNGTSGASGQNNVIETVQQVFDLIQEGAEIFNNNTESNTEGSRTLLVPSARKLR